MNEEHLEAYRIYQGIIAQLLNCNSNEEVWQILDANRDWVDAELQQTMQEVAEDLRIQGDLDNANFLMNIVEQLMGLSRNTSDAQLNFLLQVLQVMAESDGDPVVVYPLLQANLNLLDNNFAQLLQSWATARLSELEPERTYSLAADIGDLSNQLRKFPLGNRANNLEIAIAGYEIVATVFNREIYPQEWAKTQHNLAGIYAERIQGNPEENLETAIHCFEAALEIRTRRDFPQQWAAIQLQLGIVYSRRLKGKQTENIERAIHHFHSALEVFTFEDFPENWGMIHSILGGVYVRMEIDIVDNIETAIDHYEAALKVFNYRDSPENWAHTKLTLGSTYSTRIRGERAENIEKAIRCGKAALKVFNRQEFSYNWAAVQQLLGFAYGQRVRGNRVENLEVAIRYCKAALEVYTPKEYSEEWVNIQGNLGSLYRRRIWADKVDKVDSTEISIDNLQEVLQANKADNMEKAIRCYEQALEVCDYRYFQKKWAELQDNLGNAYSERVLGDPSENLEIAIQCFLDALSVFPRQTQKWAMAQTNLGLTYRARIRGERTENLKAAIRSLSAASEVFTRRAFPKDYVVTQFNLGVTYKDAHQFPNAFKSFADAIKAIEALRLEIILGSGVEEDKQKLAEDWHVLYHRIVEVCLELAKNEPQYYDRAIEYVERSKARNLVELLSTKNLYPKRNCFSDLDNYQRICAQLDQLRREIPVKMRQLEIIRSQDSEQEKYSAGERLEQDLNELQKQRENILKKIEKVDPNFNFTQRVEFISFKDIQALCDRHAAIVAWYITRNQFFTFIVTYNSLHPNVWQSSPEDCEALWNFCHQYINVYHTQKNQWQENLKQLLNQLGKILHLDETLAKIPDECDQLILIPHLQLHCFPLHALPLPDQKNKYLVDKFKRGIRYAPSCQLLQLSQTQQSPDFTHLFAIQNPTDDLDYTNLEVETIKSFFQATEVLASQDASEANLKVNQNLTTAHCSHFSCHGYFNLESPLESALVLAEAKTEQIAQDKTIEDGLLTLGEIFGFNLSQCRLVTLSACETGLIDSTNISDEYIGLPSGFLVAGSPAVVSSLWTVNELSTALLMIKFYENLNNQMSLAVALNQAQFWLRDVTKEELQQWTSHLSLSRNQREQLGDWFDKPGSIEKPFQEPYHWAGFCAIGE